VKVLLLMALLVIVASGRMTAQSARLNTPTAFVNPPVQHASGFDARFARQFLPPAQRSVGAAIGSADSSSARHHHVRNGAITGGSIGFIAGAIGGSLLSNTCVNCSKGTITGEILAVGVAGGLVGAILGSVTGQVFGWTHHRS
jgi:hypothetical protein